MDGRIRGANAAEIAESVRELVETGALATGAALPPIRALAAELGVNRNTVASAYAQLGTAGVVESRRRGGTVVLGVPAVDGEGFAASSALVNLADGNPSREFLPDVTAAYQGYEPPLYGHEPVSGALAAWARQAMSPDAESEHRLVLTHGSLDAVERCLNSHLTRGDAVAVEDPCFLSSIGTARANGFRPVPIPIDAEGMDPDGLRAALVAGARAVVCTPRAHNPTGAALSAGRARQLREVLADFPGVLVIEDDHFSAISAQPYHRITPPSAPRWALLRSVSKFLGPDLRLSFVLADPATAARLEARLNPAWVSHLLQHLVAGLLSDPGTAQLLQRARDAYATRSRSLIEALRQNGITVADRCDGLNVWIPVPGRTQRVIAALAERGWAVRPGADFAVTRSTASAIRVTTAGLTPQQAQAFAADLARAMP
ncbi:aminotransferase class I/II-fold pyridoxal phosphate-dependent enzyme [Streptomyces sp. 3N207]|uniref:aminotransferase class I/II-fold pyridoxal phosphate-dependent enzyme n=1 Tax=Streptomyces sp. 3N207 TaxID=3457417 RepID=UPI003FD2BDEA